MYYFEFGTQIPHYFFPIYDKYYPKHDISSPLLWALPKNQTDDFEKAVMHNFPLKIYISKIYSLLQEPLLYICLP